MSQIEVITLGETMLRLSPPGMMRLEQATALEAHVGGSESNTAVGLARLGVPVAWLSRLTRNPIGRLISKTIASNGVDCSNVIWTDQDRNGTYFMERGQTPRQAQVYYDRAQSAMACMPTTDLPVDLFGREGVKLFHTTGITIGISKQSGAVVERAVQLAEEHGLKFSFDLNYRAKLWTPEEALAQCESFFERCHVCFIPVRDAKALWQLDLEEPREIAEALRDRYGQCIWVLTQGEQGASLMSQAGEYIHQPAFATNTVERLGGGDAFSAGFLAGWLRGQDLRSSLRLAAAAAAIKYTIPGDLPLFDQASVEELAASANGGQGDIVR